MRGALVGALLCGVAIAAAAQGREVTFEEPQPVTVTGFAVGDASYDRVARSNTFTAGKIGVSLFKPVGEAYLFAQLTTALEDGESSTEIDNLLVSWTPQRANRWTLAFGRFDAPIGFERDDEPLNLITTNSFNFTYARPSKLTGVQVHCTASSRLDIWAVAANGWDVAADNNRGKTALGRAQLIPIPWVTVGVTGVYGPERDSTDAHQRSPACPPPTDRAPRGDPGGLGHPAVLHRRDRWAAGLGQESRPRARVHLLGGEASHAVRPTSCRPADQMARHLPARDARPVLPVRRPDGLAVRGLHTAAGGGNLRRARDVHANAARDDHGRRASDHQGRLRPA